MKEVNKNGVSATVPQINDVAGKVQMLQVLYRVITTTELMSEFAEIKA
jgi:hypothetical protein